MRNNLIVIFLVSMFLLSACSGTPFKWDQARQIKEGMTDKELVALMGPPYMVRVTTNGQHLYQWVYADLYGISGGTRILNVALKDNKVVTVPVVPEAFK